MEYPQKSGSWEDSTGRKVVTVKPRGKESNGMGLADSVGPSQAASLPEPAARVVATAELGNPGEKVANSG